jgi:ADP-heptose:LPS heptosyltransferase
MKGWAGVCRLGGIGDDLIAASVLRPLKKTGYMVDMITSPPNHVLFHNNPFIDKLSVKREHDLPQGDQMLWQKWFESRAAEYDIFANLSHSCEALHAFFPHQTQFWWRAEYRRKLCAGSYIETVHDIVGVPYEFGSVFFPTEQERERAAEKKAEMGGKVIGWVIAGSRIDKMYPYSPMVIGRLIKELGYAVLMVGAPDPRQAQASEQIMDHIAQQNGDANGLYRAMTQEGFDPGGNFDWPVRRSLSQLLACDLVITPDTGAAWAVAFEPTPKIIMVSHASVDNITRHNVNTIALSADPDRVPCFSCHRLHNDPSTCVPNKDGNAAACLSDLSVELIVTAAKAALGNGSSLARLRSEWASNVTLQQFPAKMGTSQNASPSMSAC